MTQTTLQSNENLDQLMDRTYINFHHWTRSEKGFIKDPKFLVFNDHKKRGDPLILNEVQFDALLEEIKK